MSFLSQIQEFGKSHLLVSKPTSSVYISIQNWSADPPIFSTRFPLEGGTQTPTSFLPTWRWSVSTTTTADEFLSGLGLRRGLFGCATFGRKQQGASCPAGWREVGRDSNLSAFGLWQMDQVDWNAGVRSVDQVKRKRCYWDVIGLSHKNAKMKFFMGMNLDVVLFVWLPRSMQTSRTLGSDELQRSFFSRFFLQVFLYVGIAPIHLYGTLTLS